MVNFNQILRSEEDPSQTWIGTTETTKTYRNQDLEQASINQGIDDNVFDVEGLYSNFKGKTKKYCLEHRNDIIKHVGFDFRGKILRKTLSGAFYFESKRERILDQMAFVLDFLVDSVKHIKKSFNWTLPKEYRDFN